MKVLERTFRKSERIVAKAKFTYMVFLREVLIAAILGGIIAVLWLFTPQINEILKQKILTQSILKWVIIGAGAFVVVLGIFEAIAKWHKEAVVTDRKFVVRSGIFRLVDIQLPLNQIKSVQVEQNIFQRILGYGRVIIIVDAMNPVVVKGIVSPARFAQCITRQKSRYEYESGNKSFRLELATSVQNKAY